MVSFSLAEKERFGLRPPPIHSRLAPCRLRCSLNRHSLLLASSATGGARNAPSLAASVALVQIFRMIVPPNKNTTRMGGVLLAEKERFELSRRVLWQPTPLAGAPLRPLEYFSIHRRVGLLV